MGADPTPIRVITIGIGGATCSGKTTLAKHIRNCLHNSVIIHQDDFVPPADTLPLDPDYGFANWDDAPGAIKWDRMAAFMSDLKKGILPVDYRSYDSFNETANVPVDDGIIAKWRLRSKQLAEEHLEKCGEKLVWAVVDGFLLYWDERIISSLDLRVFLRVPEEIAKARREARSYHTPEGDIWRDPPMYWEKVVWPAHVRAHRHIFKDEDVEKGDPNGKVKEMILFDSTATKVDDMLSAIMDKIFDFSASRNK